MENFFGYRDPLASGHAAADRILEQQKKEEELAEANLHSDMDNLKEDIVSSVENDDKENPGEEYYERFEQFKDPKNRPDVHPVENKKVDNKKSGKWPPHRGPRAFDPYK